MKILILEDNPDHAELIEDACQSAFKTNTNLQAFTTLEAGLAALQAQAFDVALFDLDLPDSNVVDTVETLTTLDTPVPVVVLTSLNDVDVAMRLIHRGIQDYLPKEELSPVLLERVCRYAIERKKQQLRLEARAQAQQMFCQSLSHDFKSPIRNIGQLATMLKDNLAERGQLTDHDQHLLQLMEQRLDSMDDLVNGLYDYLSVDGMGLQMDRVDLDAVLNRVLSGSEWVQNKQPVIRRQPLPGVQGNASLLYILLLNLIENAIKYSQGEPIIDIAWSRQGEHAQLCVKDNGIGIAAEYQEFVFQPFKRLNTGRSIGSGLGLAIVSRIVEHHKGRIVLQSRPGEGSTFYVSLPLAGD
ncbi:ATP-binding protein [Ketobacter sp.]|uniref:ATP-binding response regulator n=1 Tax=Ketobacter sp. TaxID=2083498 RepID=UPI000F0E133D|nr:ATP-binding protein [Ketobacter sp.]RLU01026.1 MAG: response regulator [Ketobacter sp.]